MRQPFNFESRKRRDKRIRVGYLSNDYRNHPVSHLILGLFGLHDRTRMKVFAYSYGENDGSDYRQRIREDCDRFVDIRDLGPVDAARSIFNDGIDILVDLFVFAADHHVKNPDHLFIEYRGSSSLSPGVFLAESPGSKTTGLCIVLFRFVYHVCLHDT